MTRTTLLACLAYARTLGLDCLGVPYRRPDGRERWWVVLYDRQGVPHHFRTRWQFVRACTTPYMTWRTA